MSLTLTRRHNVDRFGYLIPTRYGNVPMVGAVATYRPGEGRFGGAVAVEEGTTNLLTTRTAPAQEVVAVSKGQKYTLSAYGNGNAMVYQQHVDDTQTDWQQGTLDGVVATAAGDLELAVEFSDDFDRSTLGPDWEIAPGTQGSVQLQNGELVLTGGSSRRMWVRTTRTFEAHSIVFRARRDSEDAGSDVGLAFNWDGNLSTSQAGEPLNGYRLYWRVWENPSLLRIARFDNGVSTFLASIEFPPDNNEHEFAILIEDGTIRVFVDGVQMLQANDSTYTSGYIGLTAREGGNRRGRYNWIVVNKEALGSRVSPILDLSPVGIAAGSSIFWTATTPAGTSVTVETNLSLDGGQTWQGWQQVTNGGPIPGISAGTNLSNARLQTRVTLQTTDPTVTPRVNSLTVEVGHQAVAVAAESLSQSSPLTFTAVGNRVRLVPSAGVTKWQLEQKPFATSFVAGTRAAGKLRYPSHIINKEQGTIALWYYTGVSNGAWRRLVSFLSAITALGVDGYYDAHLDISPDNIPRFRLWSVVGGGSTDIRADEPLQENTWYFIACTWSQSGIRLFVNDNVYFGSYSEGFKVLDEVIGVGADVRAEGASARPANGLIDELLILPYAASEEEIRAWYEADGPLPPHPAALLQWDWQAVRPATMVAL